MAVTPADVKAWRTWARQLLSDAIYVRRTRQRLERGEAPHLERLFLRHVSTPPEKRQVKFTGGLLTRALLYEQNPDLPPPPGRIGAVVERARHPDAPRPLSALEKEAITPGLEFMQSALSSPRYRWNLQRRLRTGTLPRANELELWRLAYGGPGQMRAEVNRRFEICLLGDLHDPMGPEAESERAAPGTRHQGRAVARPERPPTIMDDNGDEAEMLRDE